jgi:hypothetical protein
LEDVMREDRYRRSRSVDDQWGLRTDRAQHAFSRFCLAWIGAGRELGFGSAYLALRTVDDLTEDLCPARRPRDEPR